MGEEGDELIITISYLRTRDGTRKWSSMFHANDCAILIFLRRVDVLELVLVEICATVTSTRPPRKGQKTDTASRHAPALILVSHLLTRFFLFPFFLSTRTFHSFIPPSLLEKMDFSCHPTYSEKFTRKKCETYRGKFYIRFDFSSLEIIFPIITLISNTIRFNES